MYVSNAILNLGGDIIRRLPTDTPPLAPALPRTTDGNLTGASAASAFEAVENSAGRAPVGSQDADRAARGERRRTCYYRMAPADDAPPASGNAYKGIELRGTRGYERFANALAAHGSGHPIGKLADKHLMDPVLDGMTFKRGTILVAPCHEGHTEADRSVRSEYTPPTRSRRSIPEQDAASQQRRTVSSSPQQQGKKAADDVTVCPSPSVWKQFLKIIAPAFGGFVDLVTGSTGTYQAIYPSRGAANTGNPCEGVDIQRDKPYDNEAHDRFLIAMALGSA